MTNKTGKTDKPTAASTDAPKEEGTKQGSAVILPNGQRRIDYIRDAYYKEGKKRGEIRVGVNDLLKEAGREKEQIPYQVVFQATKTGKQGDATTDPRNQPKEAGSGEKAAG